MYVYITDMKVDAGSGSLISSGMSFHSFGPLIAKALSPFSFQSDSAGDRTALQRNCAEVHKGRVGS